MSRHTAVSARQHTLTVHVKSGNKGSIYWKATTQVAWATFLQKSIPVSQRSLNTTRHQFHL